MTALKEALTAAIEKERSKPDYIDGYAVNLLIAAKWGMALNAEERAYINGLPQWQADNVKNYMALKHE